MNWNLSITLKGLPGSPVYNANTPLAMTESQRHILDLVMDKTALRKISDLDFRDLWAGKNAHVQ